MVTPLEIGLLVLVAAVIFGAYAIIKVVKPFIVNAVIGLVVLAIAGFLGFGVNITWVAVLIVAIGGIPGALLVLLLGHFGILFSPVGLLPLVVLG
ncbi:MAG: pro-sigmaK processing inhibitor BofA family protein [Halodesulfurarchaeum sp.]